MFRREYLEDSDSFSDPSDQENPPYDQQHPGSFQPAHLERDFEYEEKPKYQNLQPVEENNFYTGPAPPTYFKPQPGEYATGGYVIDGSDGSKQNMQPVRKENSEKVGFINIEYPERQEPRPDTNPARPGSSNAQMRAMMLAMQREKLKSRGGSGTAPIQSSDFFKPGISSGLEQQSKIENYLDSNKIFNEKDLSGNKELRGFTAPKNFAYEPGPIKARQPENLPGPIKPERTVFKDEEVLEEVKLEEGSRNTPSKTLQGIHKQLEDQKNQPVPTPQYERPSQPQSESRSTIVTEQFIPPEPKYAHLESKPSSQPEQYIKPPIVEAYQPDRSPHEKVLLGSNDPQRQQSRDEKPNYSREERPTPNGQDERRPPEDRLPPQNNLTPQNGKAEPPAPTNPLNKPDSADVKRQQNIPREPSLNIREALAQDMTDMRKFLTSPIRRGMMLQCNIRREKGFYSKYYFHITDGMTFLLAGKKRGGNRTSNYMITNNQKEFSVKSPAYSGKVRSNFLGTEFHIFDTGMNPKHRGANPMNAREELAIVLYQSNILGAKGPRKMRVLIPAVNNSGDHCIWKPMNKEEGMLQQYNAGNTSGMFCFFNKPPKWNEHVQAFVLNFNGRVDRASVKNFQLIDDRDENKIYMQFGRVGDQNFNLDFQWPFSPLQAFGIALSSFDYKFACE